MVASYGETKVPPFQNRCLFRASLEDQRRIGVGSLGAGRLQYRVLLPKLKSMSTCITIEPASVDFGSLSLEQKLDRLAEVAVKIGLGLKAGQELVMTAPIDALPLVRRITEHAYKAGALLVTNFYSDDPCVLARFEYGPDASFDYAPVWLQEGIATAFKSGAARLAIVGANPALLAKQDPAKVARANVAMSKASKPAMELITRHEINWTIVACATPEWAKLVFPCEPVDVAVAKLWEAIFVSSRVDVDDPVKEWQGHWGGVERRGGIRK